jgi:hypothetical protein
VPDTLDNPALQFPLRLTYLTLQLIGKFNGDEGPEHFFLVRPPSPLEGED